MFIGQQLMVFNAVNGVALLVTQSPKVSCENTMILAQYFLATT